VQRAVNELSGRLGFLAGPGKHFKLGSRYLILGRASNRFQVGFEGRGQVYYFIYFI
jgi:hypothetical protein